MKLLPIALLICLAAAGCAPSAPSASSRPAGSTAGMSAGVDAFATIVPPVATSAASNAASEAAAYRQRVVQAAQAEGEVNALIQSSWTPDGIRALEDTIAKEFGVRIKINFTPVGNYPVRVASLLTELEANVTPSFDLVQSSNTSSMKLLDANAVQTVTWPALLPQGTPREIVKAGGQAVVVYTGHVGAIYDPNVVADADAPRSLKDLGDPRWRGRFMMYPFAANYALSTVRLGREGTLASLRGAVQNGAVVDTYANTFTRYAAKEYPFVLIDSSYYATALRRGVPAKFTSLDYASNSEHHLTIMQRSPRSHAAMLLAAVLVSPEGQRIADELLGIGNLYYETSLEYRLAAEAKAAGFPSLSWFDPEGLELARSPRLEELEREISTILQGG